MYSIKFEIKYHAYHGWQCRYDYDYIILDGSSFSRFEWAFFQSIKMTDSEKFAKFANWTKMVIEIHKVE